MDQGSILGPLYAMVGLTIVVWMVMFARRIPFIQNSGMTPEQLATPGLLNEMSPPAITNPSDNLKNLFEMPVLFYATVLAIYTSGQVDSVHVGSAWAFVFFRVLHSAMHCTINVVLVRFYLYAGSCLALFVMVGRAVWNHF